LPWSSICGSYGVSSFSSLYGIEDGIEVAGPIMDVPMNEVM